jgi:hypothetical protein
MISARHAPVVTVLLALALIPTIRNTYVDAHIADGRTTQAIPTLLAGQYGTPTERGTGWAKGSLAAEDAIERRYGGDTTLFVARSFDAKQLYHHPELAVAYGRSDKSSGVRPAAARPDVPVHWLKGENAWALYVLEYGDAFVADPFRFEIRRAIASVVQPREPMTLFFVHGRGAAPPTGEAILLAAVESFRSQRTPAP